MSGLSEKAWLRWWDAQPEGEYVCTDCGARGPRSEVQPQHPYYAGGREGTALCGPCIGRRHQERREAMRRARAALPRCVACQRPATYWHPRVEGGTPLCGHHYRILRERVEADMFRQTGGLWLGPQVVVLSRQAILDILSGRSPEQGVLIEEAM